MHVVDKLLRLARRLDDERLAVLVLEVAGLVGAQTRERVTTRAILGWDMESTLPAVANATLYRVYIDGAAVGQLLPGAVCTAANLGAQATPGSTCQAPFPPLTPGDHTLTLTADLDSDESAQSAPALAVTFTVRVTPTNTRVVRKLATALPK